MANLHTEILSIEQELETAPDGRPQVLHEWLFFPELLTYGHRVERLQQEGKTLAVAILKEASLNAVHQRQVPDDVALDRLTLEVAPVKSSAAWSEPIPLELPFLKWTHGDGAHLAYVPALRIEVIASDGDSLVKELEDSVRFALRRKRLIGSLLALAKLQRAREVRIERLVWNALTPTAAERLRDLYETTDKEVEILKHVATHLRPKEMPEAYHRGADVERLVHLLVGKRKGSVLLVGPSGVGKTALVHEMVRSHWAEDSRKLPVWQTSGSRLIAGQTGFGMWQQRCRDLIQELKRKPAVLYLGNLFELMQVGQSSSNAESMASFLRPAMIRGELLAIVECTPDQLSAIEMAEPKLLDAFRQLPCEEPDAHLASQILAQVGEERVATRASLSAEASQKVEALHRRYAAYSAFPGRAIRFLRRLRLDAPKESTVETSAVIKAYARETGLPEVILDDAVSFDHATVNAWFAARVMHQEQATRLVVDTLAMIKTRLSRPQKPLASFMFIGPTGVGKTELAKTLASYLYNNPDRMIRFDMSEYGSPGAAQRLVSDRFKGGEGLLTAAVRDQPFSVILLDEFEKAAPEVFDLFLQVLGEGRLTDGAGRLADFINTVVIITSNLGAASFGRHQLGFDADPDVNLQALEHFTEAVKKEVRPEFFNRLDQIVPFYPLTRTALREIAARQLDLARQRSGLTSRRLALEVAPDYLETVISEGYDPRYGARPLKRAVERLILLPVSEHLNAHPREAGTLQVNAAAAGGTQIAFTPNSKAVSSDGILTQCQNRISVAGGHRLFLSKLQGSSLLGELRSEVFRIEQTRTWEKRRARRRVGAEKQAEASWYVPFEPKVEARLKQVTGVIERLETKLQEVIDYEEAALIALYQADGVTSALLDEIGRLSFTQKEQDALTIDSYATYENTRDLVTVVIHGDASDWQHRLFCLYAERFKDEKGARLRAGLFPRNPKDDEIETVDEGRELILPKELDEEAFRNLLKGPLKESGALILEIEEAQAWLHLRHESGLHANQISEDRRVNALVTVFNEPMKAIRMEPTAFDKIHSVKAIAVRREFHFEKGYRDTHLNTKDRRGLSSELIEELLRENLLRDALEAVNAL